MRPSLLTASAILFLLLSSTTFLNSQSWTDYSTVETEEEFRQIQKDFEAYWANREIGKGQGYKPFKRWEYKWEERILNGGKLPAAGRSIKEFTTYLKNNPILNQRDANSSWESLGPNSTTGGYAGTGRINTFAVDPSNSNTIYVGAAGGGLWKSTNRGSTWTPKTDFIGSIGVSGIVIDYNNPSTLYIGTGDGDANDNYSIGVLKSTDGGDTWSTTGLDWGTSANDVIRNMVMSPSDSDLILVASNVGIYRTIDGGTNWSMVQSGSFYDVEMNPLVSSNTFYAVTSNTVYKSTNNGGSWTSKEVIANSNRLSIATTAANSDYLYVLSSGNGSGANGGSGFNGVFRSTDGGENFSLMGNQPNILGYASDGSGSGGQGWYDLVIAANPTNANTIHVAGVNHWKSTDGGASWTIKSHWSGSGGIFEVHADKHLLEFEDGNNLWEGNDGGIYISTNGGDTWTDKTSNLVISQMYRIGVAETNERMLAGLQDNGTKRKDTNGAWDDVIGGDGMDCAISSLNGSIMYGEYQNGNISRSNNGGATWTSISGSLPAGAWVTPIALDEEEENTVYVGFDKVYKSTNQGSAWTAISDPILGNKMTMLQVSNVDANYIYAAKGSQMYATEDGGSTWTERGTPGSLSMVKISKANPKTIYATRSNFNAGEKVYKSLDGGMNWINISGTLPNMPANCIAIHDDGEETLYVGMDVGVYYKNESTPDWTLMNVDLPNAEIREIEIKESTNQIYLATYGRGVWRNSTINSTSTCKAPKDLTVDVLVTTGTASWTAPDVAPGDGYVWAFDQSVDPPSTGTSTTNLSVELSNILEGNEYYFHVRSDCGSDNSGWISYGPIKQRVSCGSDVYDSGGESGDYGNNENEIVTICPTPGQTNLTLTFNAFSVESGYDALYIHNGPDVNSPLFPGGTTAMSSSFPVGGFNGTTIPGPFTSTDNSGCITLHFRSDNSVVQLGWDVDVTCTEDPSCQLPQNVSITDVGATAASISWEAPFNPPANGYEYAVDESSAPPISGISTTDLSVGLTGLNAETAYYFHVRSLCGAENSSWLSTPFNTGVGCGSNLYDNGGPAGDYGDNLDITTTVCADGDFSDLTLTFDAFGIEVGYDALYIHDGPDVNAPLFPGGVTSMSNTFPVGGFNGTSIPGPFTSTNASGCITLRMRSDQSVVELGYSTVVSCGAGCTTVVSNLNDSGNGSMRSAIDCAEDGGAVTIDPSLFEQTIIINQPIVINKELSIMPPLSSAFNIGTSTLGPVFDIQSGGDVELDNMTILSGSANTAAAIRNSGMLDLKNVIIMKNLNNPSPTSLIENNGAVNVSGNTEVKE